MGEYKCRSCAIHCKCIIPDECDFVPKVCLAQLEKAFYVAEWVDGNNCDKCGCPIKEKLDNESCWCGVKILKKEDMNKEDDYQ